MQIKQILKSGLWMLMLLGTISVSAQATGLGSKTLVPVGHTVGIKLFSKGVVVVKLKEGGTPAKACGLRTGDVIVSCGGQAVSSTEQFQSILQENGETALELDVQRSSGSVTLSVEPEKTDDGRYAIGAWIRDSMAGIGTVTYYDPETGKFGALGHGITDADTAQLMPFSRGSILPSTVKAVKQGAVGAAGELRGDFDLTCDLGSLYANTACGIFGTLADQNCTLAQGTAMPVGEAHAGKAQICANVQGDTVDTYEIEILRTDLAAADGRELVLAVRDPKLLKATGGIVQGMSGSPILQDGAIVGAVTHVLLSDPGRGYGITIETMLSAA